MSVTKYVSLATLKAEFAVNGLRYGNQFGSEVIGLRGGGFAIAYGTASGLDRSMAVSLFDADFAPIGPEGQQFTLPYVGPSAGVRMEETPQIVQWMNGQIGVYWSRQYDYSGDESFYSLIDPRDGNILVPQTLWSNFSSIDDMEVMALPTGGLAIAKSTGISIHLAMRGSDGSHTALYSLSPPNFDRIRELGACALPSGSILLCYVGELATNALGFEIRSGSGGPTGSSGVLASGRSRNIVGDISVTGMPDDGFAVAYANAKAGVSLFIVPGQSASHGTVGPVRVDTNLAAVETDVSLTTIGDKVLVMWTELNGSGKGNILARLFDVFGQPVAMDGTTDPYLVAGGVSDQTEARATLLSSGAVIFTWTDATGDGSDAGIRGKILVVRDVTIGDALANDLQGGETADLMRGLEGSDTLDGGAGGDTLFGGAGDDIYYVDNASDRTIEKANEGVDLVNSSVTWSLSPNTEQLVLTGSRDINGFGGASVNLITGNSGDNKLGGGGGHDTLAGNGGRDLLIGGSGDDLLYGGDGFDQLIGGTGNDSLSGEITRDLLFGGDGDDVVNGGRGNDLLVGGAGQDSLTGGDGKDRFEFLDVTDSPSGSGRDIIVDFRPGDVISLALIDAITDFGGIVRNDTFTFIGANVFSAAGQLRFDSGVLSGDVDGNRIADFEIVLQGVTSLSGAWLVA